MPGGIPSAAGGGQGGEEGGGQGAWCGHVKRLGRCGACGDVPGDRKRAREEAVGEDGEEDEAGGEEERGRPKQRTGPAKWVRKKCEHGRRKDTCKDCGGASICQHNREHLPGRCHLGQK